MSLTGCSGEKHGPNGPTASTDLRTRALSKLTATAEAMHSASFYAYCSGTVEGGGLYTQKIASNKVKLGDELFFETFTLGKGNGMLSSLKIEKSEQRYENRVSGSYAYVSSKSGTEISGTLESGYQGSCTFHDSFVRLDESGYLKEFGHSVFDITNYSLTPENYERTIIDVEETEAGSSEIAYRYHVSVTAEDGREDATAGYKLEMEHMSGMGKPKFTSVYFDMILDKDSGRLKEIRTAEEYNMKALLFNISCTSSLVTKFEMIEDQTDLPKNVEQNYIKALAKLEA